MKSIILISILLVVLYSASQETTSTVKIADGVYVSATTIPFVISEHKIDTCFDELRYPYTCKIDGRKWYGGGNELAIPRNKIVKLKLSYGMKSVRLYVRDMYDASFEGIIYESQFKWRINKNIYYLIAHFSDGAGGYSVKWKIDNNVSTRTYICSDMGEYFFDFE